MKLPIALLALLSIATFAATQPGEPLRLWEGDAPGALGQADHDIPTLTPFLPAAGTANGTAIVICPGGGYGGLAPHEGAGYAEYLAGKGVACFVLKYRLGSKGYRHPVMMHDVQRAIRLPGDPKQQSELHMFSQIRLPLDFCFAGQRRRDFACGHSNQPLEFG